MDAHAYDVKYIKIIESIASVAAYQVEGVASLTNEAGAIFNVNAYPKKGKNSVQAIVKDGKVIIDIYLNAYSNTTVPELSLRLQQKIIQEVEKSTNIKVKAVNIHIIGIVFPS